MVLAWSVFEEMPSPPLFLPPTSKANMFCCGVGFFQHPLQHELSGTTGSFSLSFVSPETDLFKWYAGSTLLLQASVLVIFLGFSTVSLKSVEDEVIPKDCSSPNLRLFCIFPIRLPFPVFWEEWCWSHLFISIWLKGEEVVRMLASLLGRVLSCLAGYPCGCRYSHPWDHCTNTLLFLSKRWLQSSLSLVYFLVTVWHRHGISCSLSQLWCCLSLPSCNAWYQEESWPRSCTFWDLFLITQDSGARYFWQPEALLPGS